jgi:hypothetical protein
MKLDNILSTLKGEYARTLILILIPGAIAFEPIAVLFYKKYSFKIVHVESLVLLVLIYFLASLFYGFLIQDLGSRIEIKLDKYYCWKHKVSTQAFYDQFELYMFNKKEEDYIITHYYRSLLVRLRFELHTCAAIILLWIGSILRWGILRDFDFSITKTWPFVLSSVLIFGYLLYEAKEGVKILHKLRIKINGKFKPSLT